MKPVIPSVRPGDVLLGTRHLRRWIQMASLYRHVHALARGESPSVAKKAYPLVSIAKDTSFVVAVNTDDFFLVWNHDRALTLLFGNFAKEQTVLSPSNFAQWFIRTDGRQPDLSSWPEWAYGFWAALHMGNSWHPSLRVSAHAGHNPIEFAFRGAVLMGKPNRMQLINGAHSLAITGFYRKGNHRKKWVSRSTGPQLRDFDDLQRQITEYSRAPHVAALLQRKGGDKGHPDAVAPEIQLALEDF